MGNIYQEIWNADQDGNGIEAILDTDHGDTSHGFVKVNSALANRNDPNLRVLTETHIPDKKRSTYDLCKQLFDNYSLPEKMPEHDTPEERKEVHDFVSAILETPPMIVAREYIEAEGGAIISRERWHNTIVEMWFRKFSSGGDPDLSGFEHIVVGEQEKGKVQGYHFWWKYFLDDGFGREVDGNFDRFPGLKDDRIRYLGSKQKGGQLLFPESVTISFKWDAPDHEAKKTRPLNKKIGGFFVGCSVEGLIALGTVRAHRGIRAPKIAVIEDARYDMKLFHSPSNLNIRTFYPIFLGPADPVDGGGRDGGSPRKKPPVDSGGGTGGGTRPDPDRGGDTGKEPPEEETLSEVRIIAAKVNPKGKDVGLETITLVNAGPEAIKITNWKLEDKNGRAHTFEEMALGSGEFKSVTLSGQDAQLSNKGGKIKLIHANGSVLQEVTYSKAQAKRQGGTVLF